jgi:hypothetical protein
MIIDLTRKIRLAPLLVVSCVLAIAATASAQDSTFRDTTRRDTAYRDTTHRDTAYRRERFTDYLDHTFGLRPTVRALALAGFNQLRGSPRDFPRTWRGYEDRLGTTYAQVAVSHTLRSGTAWIVDERTMAFEPCTCRDSSRLLYAIESPFRVITPHGVRLSLYNPITEVVSGVLVTPLHGSGVRVGEGVVNGLLGIAGESVWSAVRQFWPWHWRLPFMARF